MENLFSNSTCSLLAAAVVGCVLVNSSQAQNQADSHSMERQVHGQTITSLSSPALEVTVDPGFTYIGQRVTLYGNADAELHLFTKRAPGGIAQSFYWIQFEHFLPTNSMRYDAASARTIEIGGVPFYVDVLGYTDFAGIQTNQPGSDGAAAAAILARRRLAFPQRVARVRMFHFPDADRRSELMIIYGEALPPSMSGPDGPARFTLDSGTTESVIDHVRQELTIRKL